MSRRTWVCAGEAACGTTSQRSDVPVQRQWSGLSAAESRLRSLRDQMGSYERGPRSSENMLLPLSHSHATRSSNSNQLRGSAANDSEPDQPGGYLILQARKLPAGLPVAVFLRHGPQYTRSEHVVSSEGCR